MSTYEQISLENATAQNEFVECAAMFCEPGNEAGHRNAVNILLAGDVKAFKFERMGDDSYYISSDMWEELMSVDKLKTILLAANEMGFEYSSDLCEIFPVLHVDCGCEMQCNKIDVRIRLIFSLLLYSWRLSQFLEELIITNTINGTYEPTCLCEIRAIGLASFELGYFQGFANKDEIEGIIQSALPGVKCVEQ